MVKVFVYPAGIYTNPVCILEINMMVWGKYRLPIHSLCSFPLGGRSVFCLQLSRMQVARLTTCLIVYCPDPPDSRRAWSSESLALYGCHYAWPLPEVNSTTVHDFTIPLSEGRTSPETSHPRTQCLPVHSALVQTVPLCAECPPTLVVLARTHEGAVEKIQLKCQV